MDDNSTHLSFLNPQGAIHDANCTARQLDFLHLSIISNRDIDPNFALTTHLDSLNNLVLSLFFAKYPLKVDAAEPVAGSSNVPSNNLVLTVTPSPLTTHKYKVEKPLDARWEFQLPVHTASLSPKHLPKSVRATRTSCLLR
ncbi:hypothetical protein D9758_012068 [Tetrapyrgos nigripes]|uniref:Uncharacterized protein n=1 Tax=Tetrapyrgos nigripes TaxID=182062 RepID=A0A8H5CBL1_9AGAR|nr:hypothetical protein D9758_012068 [Tetrapyrgos nigripes]